MEEKKLNEKESLELIAQMISSTKQRFEGGSSKPFLIFGYTTVIIALLVYLLISKTANYQFHWLWFLIPIVGYFGMYLSRKKNQRRTKNQIDFIIRTVWFVNGIACFIIALGAFYVRIPILSMIVLLMGICTAITGLIIKSKLISISGFIGMFSSTLLFLINGNEKILVFGLVFLVTMIIPGHILNFKTNKKDV